MSFRGSWLTHFIWTFLFLSVILIMFSFDSILHWENLSPKGAEKVQFGRFHRDPAACVFRIHSKPLRFATEMSKTLPAAQLQLLFCNCPGTSGKELWADLLSVSQNPCSGSFCYLQLDTDNKLALWLQRLFQQPAFWGIVEICCYQFCCKCPLVLVLLNSYLGCLCMGIQIHFKKPDVFCWYHLPRISSLI